MNKALVGILLGLTLSLGAWAKSISLKDFTGTYRAGHKELFISFLREGDRRLSKTTIELVSFDEKGEMNRETLKLTKKSKSGVSGSYMVSEGHIERTVEGESAAIYTQEEYVKLHGDRKSTYVGGHSLELRLSQDQQNLVIITRIWNDNDAAEPEVTEYIRVN